MDWLGVCRAEAASSVRIGAGGTLSIFKFQSTTTLTRHPALVRSSPLPDDLVARGVPRALWPRPGFALRRAAAVDGPILHTMGYSE